jgi:hypothetical protein
MTATQARLAETIDLFYGAADKTSEGAMAAHAYKAAVEELDTGIGRELVSSLWQPLQYLCSWLIYAVVGGTISTNHYGTPREDERIFPHCKRAHRQTEQESMHVPHPVMSLLSS